MQTPGDNTFLPVCDYDLAATLTSDEVAAFERYNAAYGERFGFPFVICARVNRKDAILAAFPKRLENSREQEIAAALAEIDKIAALRMNDAIWEDEPTHGR